VFRTYAHCGPIDRVRRDSKSEGDALDDRWAGAAAVRHDVEPSPPERLTELDALFDSLHAYHGNSRHTTS
jgi:hypothetical protein